MASNNTDSATHITSTKAAQNRKTVTVSLKPILGAVLLIVLLGLSFFAGRQYQKHSTSSTTTMAMSGPTSQAGPGSNAGGQTGGFGNRGGGIGTVTAVSATSISISNPRTSTTETFSITSATTVTDNGSASTVSAIETGSTVFIRTSGSGSTVATTIAVNPTFGGSQAGGSPTPPTQ